MNGYHLDHKDFSFDLSLPESLLHLKDCEYVIRKVKLDSLFARIVSKKTPKKVVHKLVRLTQTPHYKYIQGYEKSYLEYLKKFGVSVGFGIEHSGDTFGRLLTSPGRYLEDSYRSNYIICYRRQGLLGSKDVILDGVHRACLLHYQKIPEIPVAFLYDPENDRTPSDQFDCYLADYKDDFLEWYTPLEIRGCVIHERTYPEFKERTEYLTNRERGKSKWDYIIQKNLPDVSDKTVCDIGCNIGLFSIYLSRLGAARVDGYDRGIEATQPSNPNLPRQSVIQQAYYVRNLFRLAGEEVGVNINFVECDLAKLDFSSLKYDVLFSCCVLYHFGDQFKRAIKQISQNIPEVFLQTNLGHKGGDLAHYASIEFHDRILKKFGYATRIDAPNGYSYPVIYGRKGM